MLTDYERIQGTWKLVGGERHGKAFGDDMLKAVTLTFTGEVLSTRTNDRNSDAQFRLHPEMTPKGLDLIMEGHVGEGIYVLEGDELRIVHGEAGHSRPRELTPAASSSHTLLVLQRSR